MELVPEMLVFARVVDTQGFSSAARQLGLSTSAVSRSVGRLEAHVGARLLQRTTRSVSVTELGREVYQRCVQIAALTREVQALAASQGGAPAGRLRISAPAVLGQVWLTPLLTGFLDAWPGVELDLMLQDRMVDLVNESVDAVIRITTDPPPGLAARPLFETRYRLVASSAWLQRHGLPLEPAALDPRELMYLGYGSFDDQLVLSCGAETRRLQMRSRITVSNTLAMLSLAQAGEGIALLPDFTAAQALREGSVQALLPDWQIAGAYRPRQVLLLYPPTPYLPAKVRVFIDHLVAAGQGLDDAYTMQGQAKEQ